MNPVLIHLTLNHAPVFGAGAGFLLLGYALLRGNAAFQRLAYVVLVLAALATPAVFLSGHASEDKVEGLIGVAEMRIHAHEEAGEGAAIAMVAVGILAAAQLVLGGLPDMARLRAKGAYGVLLGAALTFGWAAYAAHMGGLIRHGAELGSPGPLAPATYPDSGD